MPPKKNSEKKKSTRKPSAWNIFVKKFRASHPGIPIKDLFKKASEAWKKEKK